MAKVRACDYRPHHQPLSEYGQPRATACERQRLWLASPGGPAPRTACRHKPRVARKLADPARWAIVYRCLRVGWSPQQIAHTLRHPCPRRKGSGWNGTYLSPCRRIFLFLRKFKPSDFSRLRSTNALDARLFWSGEA